MSMIKIKNKEYELELPWAVYRKITKRVNSSEMSKIVDVTELKPEEMEKFLDERADILVENLWDCLKANKLGLKPYLTKKRLLKKITAQELLGSDKLISEMMTTEDRNEGN